MDIEKIFRLSFPLRRKETGFVNAARAEQE